MITDNDSDDISWRQIAVQGLCLGYLDADAEVAAFTRYHRTPDGGTERGGRVNASMGGLLDMLSNQRLCDEFGYGFSGDQGGKLKLFQDFCCPEHYGIEVSMRIQFHSMINGFDSNKIKVDRDKLYQPEIGGSDDQAIGEGKPKEDALKGIIDMSQQIAGSFLATIGYENLRNYWDSPEKFMQDFKLRQIVRMEAWRRASRNDYNTVLPISGGIEDQELRDITYEATNRIVKRFYSDENYRAELLEEFLPSPNNLITSIGPNKYFELGKDLSQHYHVIAV